MDNINIISLAGTLASFEVFTLVHPSQFKADFAKHYIRASLYSDALRRNCSIPKPVMYRNALYSCLCIPGPIEESVSYLFKVLFGVNGSTPNRLKSLNEVRKFAQYIYNTLYSRNTSHEIKLLIIRKVASKIDIILSNDG